VRYKQYEVKVPYQVQKFKTETYYVKVPFKVVKYKLVPYTAHNLWCAHLLSHGKQRFGFFWPWPRSSWAVSNKEPFG